jgi:hypothetical protein
VCIERGAWTCRSAVLCQVNSREGRLFPGLLLEAFVAGGTTDVGASRALLTVTVYLLIAATITATTFARRDVTA